MVTSMDSYDYFYLITIFYLSALLQLLQVPILGQHYDTFDVLKKTMQDWEVHEKFHYEISHKHVGRSIPLRNKG